MEFTTEDMDNLLDEAQKQRLRDKAKRISEMVWAMSFVHGMHTPSTLSNLQVLDKSDRLASMVYDHFMKDK